MAGIKLQPPDTFNFKMTDKWPDGRDTMNNLDMLQAYPQRVRTER